MPGNDSYTKLLLHMDDTGLTDSSSSSHSVTLNGDAAISAVQNKFGGYSANFNGAGYLSIPNHADFNFGTGNFTIDFWIRKTVSDLQYIIAHNDGVALNSDWAIGIWAGTVAGFHLSYGLTNYNVTTTSNITEDNLFHHIAIVRNGSDVKIACDGIFEDTVDVNGVNPNGVSSPFIIGRRGTASDYYLNAYIDELRVSKGIARWTEDFTPPEYPYASSAYSIQGSSNDSAEVIIINESNWEVNNHGSRSAGSYDIATSSGTKLIVAKRSDGEIISYGNVNSVLSETNNNGNIA